jgi:hypothetical protein
LELNLHKAGTSLRCPSYPLTGPASEAYQKLFHQFSSKKYLDIKLPVGAEDAHELEGHYKLASLDACYHGEWKGGHPHGRGLATLLNGSLLVGTFSEGFCIG